MILHVIGLFVFLLVGTKGDTTEGYRTILRPLIEECRVNLTFTGVDAEAVLHMPLHFPPAARCLAECCMTKLGMMRDGKLVPPEELVIVYKDLFFDETERLKDPHGVITACYEEVAKENHHSSCEVAFHAVACSTIRTYGLGKETAPAVIK